MIESLVGLKRADIFLQGLVSWWPLNGTLQDIGPAKRHGSNGGASSTTFKNRVCTRLNGSSYVAIPSFAIGVGPWTFSTWIAGVDWITSYSHLFSAATQSTFALKVSKPFGSTPGGVPYIHQSTFSSQVGQTAMALNTWYMVSFTYDGNNSIRLYVNGVLDSTFTVNKFTVSASTFRIGNSAETSEYTNGYQADLRYWNRLLSGVELKRLYDETYIAAVSMI